MSDEFRLTPVDVRRMEFPKSMRGYDQGRVDDFREQVADELERLLNAVFTHVRESSFPRRFRRIGAMCLGHGYDRDALSMSPPNHGGINTLPDLPHALRQVRKTHNVPSYRRLQSEASESLWAWLGLVRSDNRGQESSPSAYSSMVSVDSRTVSPSRHRSMRRAQSRVAALSITSKGVARGSVVSPAADVRST